MPRKKAVPTILVQFRAPVSMHRALSTIARNNNMSINAFICEAMVAVVAAHVSIKKERKEKQ